MSARDSAPSPPRGDLVTSAASSLQAGSPDLNYVWNDRAVTTRQDVIGMATMKHMDERLPGWHPDPVHGGELRWWNGNEWTAYVRNLRAIPKDKSVGVAFALTFFFGPLGLFYVSTLIAVVALVINFVVLVMTLGLGVTLTWPATIILGCILADRRHRDYQAWLSRSLGTTDSASLTGSWPVAEASARRTSPTHGGLFGNAPRMRLVNGLAGWQPDPTGRFERRWWSGDTWTPHVMNGEYRTMDPLWRR